MALGDRRQLARGRLARRGHGLQRLLARFVRQRISKRRDVVLALRQTSLQVGDHVVPAGDLELVLENGVVALLDESGGLLDDALLLGDDVLAAAALSRLRVRLGLSRLVLVEPIVDDLDEVLSRLALGQTVLLRRGPSQGLPHVVSDLGKAKQPSAIRRRDLEGLGAEGSEFATGEGGLQRGDSRRRLEIALNAGIAVSAKRCNRLHRGGLLLIPRRGQPTESSIR